jgi:hypothetical protein
LEFEDLIELVRDSYISQFSDFIDRVSKEHGDGSGEVKLKLSGDSALYRNYYCADYVRADDGGNVIELAPDEEVTFDPVDVVLGQMDMRVERLQWNDVTLKLEGVLDSRDLDEWFETWFDPDDTTFDPDTRFSGNIHSLTVDDEGVHVDLGTAPTEALVDLLVTIEDLGYRKVTVN